MRKQVVDLLTEHELKQFIRNEPIWYRKLTRNPLEVEAFKMAANQFYKRTFPQKFERAVNSIELAGMMLQMFQTMGNND